MTDEARLKRRVWKAYCRARRVKDKFDPARVHTIWESEQMGIYEAMYEVDGFSDLRIYKGITFTRTRKTLITVYEFCPDISGECCDEEEDGLEKGESGK